MTTSSSQAPIAPPPSSEPAPAYSGPWGEDEVRTYLDDAEIPVRLSCNGPAGFPLVASLWFVHEAGELWCATRPDSEVARRLTLDPRCAFEVAADGPPYRGVRGIGQASFEPGRGRSVLERLIERYQGRTDNPLGRWLLGRADDELAVRIAPIRMMSWDYRERMKS